MTRIPSHVVAGLALVALWGAATPGGRPSLAQHPRTLERVTPTGTPTAEQREELERARREHALIRAERSARMLAELEAALDAMRREAQ